METETQLMLAVIFGSIGLGFFTYGKRQKANIPLWSGVALLGFPYFISNTLMMIIIGLMLVSLPYFLRR